MVSSRLAPWKSAGDHVGHKRRGEHAQQHQKRCAERQNGGNRAGYAAGFFFVALREQTGVNGDERRREHSFAEEILQKIGDAEGNVEGVRGVGKAEGVRRCAGAPGR